MCTVQAEVNRSYTKHRKIASSFRDTQLFEIFELGVNLLKKAYEMIKTVDYSDADQVTNIMVFAVVLLLYCYSLSPDSIMLTLRQSMLTLRQSLWTLS